MTLQLLMARSARGGTCRRQSRSRATVGIVLIIGVVLAVTSASSFVPAAGQAARKEDLRRQQQSLQADPFLVRRRVTLELSHESPASSPLSGFEEFVDEKLLGAKRLAESDLVLKVQSVAGEEKFESIKTGIVTIAFAVLPEAIIAWLDPERLTPRWGFQLDMLALQVILFGLVYRYAIRDGDDNEHQNYGVIAAFVLPRALFMVQMPTECVAASLSCEPPLGYFNWDILAQVAKQLVIGGVAIGAAAWGLDRAFRVELIKRFAGPAAAIAPPEVEEPKSSGPFP